jgi:hypothetical protein
MVEAHRVWVHLRKMTDGHWGAFGEIVTVRDLVVYGFKKDEPESKTARMRDAAMQSIGAMSAG